MLLGEPVAVLKVGYLKSMGLKLPCPRFMLAVRSVDVGRDEKNDGWLRALAGGVKMGDKARSRPAGESDP